MNTTLQKIRWFYFMAIKAGYPKGEIQQYVADNFPGVDVMAVIERSDDVSLSR
jgi:hypothetical protein